MKKLVILLLGLTVPFFATSNALALSWATGMADIYGAGGLDVAIPGSDGDFFSSIADPWGGTITFDNSARHAVVPTSWATWSHGYTGPVLWAYGLSSIRLTFDNPITAFGLYAEPNPFMVLDMTLGLSDGSTQTQAVDGQGGAAFFGFLDGSVSWMEIGIEPGYDFAFGEMVQGAYIPEPSTLMLLGTGLLGLGAFRLRRRK